MATKSKIRTISDDLIPRLVEAGLAGDRQRLELLSLTAVRSLKNSAPDIAREVGDLLAKYASNSESMRWRTSEPPPTDADAGFALVRFSSPENVLEPVLAPSVYAQVVRLIRERHESERLLREGIIPPRSLLLQGPPGTGKTMLARFIAHRLDLPLVVLDLASAMSSFLGKTGTNLRRSLDYARSTPCVLLLDEFDSIAKRRDDATEIGELKRIVNVLLKELEEWTLHSVLIAATNHPELLDPAVRRRFDVVLEIPLPGEAEREQILQQSTGRFSSLLPPGFLAAVSRCLVGTNGSEIHTVVQGAIRRNVIEGRLLAFAFVQALTERMPAEARKDKGPLIRVMHAMANLTVRELGELFELSPSAIQHYIKKKTKKTKAPQYD